MKNLIIAIILIFAGVSQAYSQSNQLIVNTVSNGTDELVHVYVNTLQGLEGTGVNYGINSRDIYTIDASRSYTLSVEDNTFTAGDGTRYSIIRTQSINNDDFRDLYFNNTFTHFGSGTVFRGGVEVHNPFIVIPNNLFRVFRYFRGIASPRVSDAIEWTGMTRGTNSVEVTVTISYSRGFWTIEYSDGRDVFEEIRSDWRTSQGAQLGQQAIIDELCRVFINPRCPGQ